LHIEATGGFVHTMFSSNLILDAQGVEGGKNNVESNRRGA
jgi:hypothetical protein